jgi:hypothetical protein
MEKMRKTNGFPMAIHRCAFRVSVEKSSQRWFVTKFGARARWHPL